jgi:hypothetical protein
MKKPLRRLGSVRERRTPLPNKALRGVYNFCFETAGNFAARNLLKMKIIWWSQGESNP